MSYEISELLNNAPSFLTQYPYRYVILILFCTGSIVSGMSWVVTSAIVQPISVAYSQPQHIVNVIPALYQLLYALGNFPSNKVVDRYGLRVSILIAGWLTFLGCCVRCLVNVHFYFVIAGQVLCAMGQPFYLSAMSKTAVRWFLVDDRAGVMSIMVASNLLGNSIGFLLPSFFIQDDQAPDSVQHYFQQVLLIEAALALLPAFFACILWKEKPPSPAGIQPANEDISYCTSMRKLFMTPKFLHLFFVFGNIGAAFAFYASLLGSVFQPFGYSSDQISLHGSQMTVVGIIGALGAGCFVQHTRKYQVTFKVLATIGIIVSVGFGFFLDRVGYHFQFSLVFVGLFGLILLAFIPILIEYTCDICYPHSQNLINGLFFTWAQLFSLILAWISERVLGLGASGGTGQQRQKSAFWTVIMMNSVLVLGLAGLYCCNYELSRSKAEAKQLQRRLSQKSQSISDYLTTQN